MVVFGGLLDFVIVVFLVLVLAEYTKIRAKSKGFNLITAAAVFALLAYGFTMTVWMTLVPTGYMWGQYLFEFLAWILLLIGALKVVADLTKAK
jgi:hypothetical protein